MYFETPGMWSNSAPTLDYFPFPFRSVEPGFQKGPLDEGQRDGTSLDTPYHPISHAWSCWAWRQAHPLLSPADLDHLLELSCTISALAWATEADSSSKRATLLYLQQKCAEHLVAFCLSGFWDNRQ